MEKINVHNLAIDVANEEGKEVSLPIGQIKEVISITLRKLSKYNDDEILEVISRYKQPAEEPKII